MDFQQIVTAHIDLTKAIGVMEAHILGIARQAIETLENGGKLIFAGNGGSAADAQHLASELVGRFTSERQALAAMALTTDTSALTSISNDYGYQQVFSRQLEAMGRSNDLLFLLSTSGNSENLVQLANTAHKMNISTIAFLGKDGGKLKSLVDDVLVVPHDVTARIQEMHLFIGHIICEAIDEHHKK